MYAWTVTSDAVGTICPRYAHRCGRPGAIDCQPLAGPPQRWWAYTFSSWASDSNPSEPGQTGSWKKWALKNHASGFTCARPSTDPNPFGPPSIKHQEMVSTMRSIGWGKGGSVDTGPE